MTISELIKKLEKAKKEHGDINVEYQYNDCGYMYGGSSLITDCEIKFETDSHDNEYKTLVIY